MPSTCPLSGRQLLILELVARGVGYEEVAQRLGVSANTVRSHLWRARRLVGAVSTSQLVSIAHTSGWLEPVLENDRGEPRGVTPLQAAYLASFDGLLAARSEGEVREARGWMDHHLTSMFYERGLGVPLSWGERLRRARTRETHTRFTAELSHEVLPTMSVPRNGLCRARL